MTNNSSTEFAIMTVYNAMPNMSRKGNGLWNARKNFNSQW